MQMLMPWSEKAAMTTPITMAILKPTISHKLNYMPTPPSDQAREYKATMVIMMVTATIMMTMPHWKVFVTNLSLQLT